MNDIAKRRRELRKAIADYMYSEGCSCCEGNDHAEVIAKLLNVKKYPDGSGYDFDRYRSN